MSSKRSTRAPKPGPSEVSFRDGTSSAYHLKMESGARLDVEVWPCETQMNDPQRRDVTAALRELAGYIAEQAVTSSPEDLRLLEQGLEQLEAAMGDFEQGIATWTATDRFTQKKMQKQFLEAAAATKAHARVLRSTLASVLAKR